MKTVIYCNGINVNILKSSKLYVAIWQLCDWCCFFENMQLLWYFHIYSGIFLLSNWENSIKFMEVLQGAGLWLSVKLDWWSHMAIIIVFWGDGILRALAPSSVKTTCSWVFSCYLYLFCIRNLPRHGRRLWGVTARISEVQKHRGGSPALSGDISHKPAYLEFVGR